MPSSKDVFLSLVRMGIGHTAEPFPNQMNWSEIKALADRQGFPLLFWMVLSNYQMRIVLQKISLCHGLVRYCKWRPDVMHKPKRRSL